jgi:hypothetical protein
MEGYSQNNLSKNKPKCHKGIECTYPNCRFEHPKGFQPNQGRRKFHKNTVEQQTKFLDTQENICNIMIKKPIKAKINEELSESYEYCTDINVRHVNKALAKKGQMTLDSRSFEKNGIVNAYGKPHSLYSFFKAMSKNSFLTVEGSDTEIIIGIHSDYKAIIAEKREHIAKISKVDKEVVPLESSSEEEEEEETKSSVKKSSSAKPDESAEPAEPREPEPAPDDSSEED